MSRDSSFTRAGASLSSNYANLAAQRVAQSSCTPKGHLRGAEWVLHACCAFIARAKVRCAQWSERSDEHLTIHAGGKPMLRYLLIAGVVGVVVTLAGVAG